MREVRILDLDGSLTSQATLFDETATQWTTNRQLGRDLRLACSFRRFHAFSMWLQQLKWPPSPFITCYGSGDFHHVTLALLGRLDTPFNLLVLDKHPDWMRGIPFMHCGTWLRHALRLPMLHRVFHCGGDLDFDNAYRWLAPWPEIQSGKIVVFPSRRGFHGGRWNRVTVFPLLRDGVPLSDVLPRDLEPFHSELRALPLYISIDKDVLVAKDAAVNWDSGYLALEDAVEVLRAFVNAAEGRLAGADLLGDWSPVELGHALNRVCDWFDHPGPALDPIEAARRNLRANEAMLRVLQSDVCP